MRTPLRHMLKDCIGTLLLFESQGKTQVRRLTQANITASHSFSRSNYLPPEAADESKVSGGSKKHLCQSAASVRAPALHCCSVAVVAAIMPPSAESKITTIPSSSCDFCESSW